MHQSLDRTLVRLRNTRDLRAEMLLLASDLSEGPHTAMLIVRDPVVSEATVRAEWDRMLQAIRPDIGRRMVLEIESLQKASARQLDPDRIRVERPNFRHEVLRLILDAQLMHAEASTVRQLVGELGSSQTPVREAIMELLRAGMITRWTQGLQLNLQQLSRERLATVRAMPQVLRFRYERGAVPRAADALVERATAWLQQQKAKDGIEFALSGTPAALADVTGLDLIGTPRLDLTVHVPRSDTHFDAGLLRQLDDGLEYEPNPLASTPVVLTLVRADSHFKPEPSAVHDWRACRADVFLSLLDMGLRDQALHYVRSRA